MGPFQLKRSYDFSTIELLLLLLNFLVVILKAKKIYVLMLPAVMLLEEG